MATLNIDSIDELGKFLDAPQKKLAWLKLDKNSKKNAATKFVDDTLTTQYNLSPESVVKCKSLLIDLINKKKLSKAKDIVFNVEEQKIEKIPCLSYENGDFVIAVEKRQSTSKSLPNMKNFVKTTSKKSTQPGKQKLSFENDKNTTINDSDITINITDISNN
tara:strand:- start:320 stop:805 length:486 start_codon:yes stop_codon:yes gene_type:complete